MSMSCLDNDSATLLALSISKYSIPFRARGLRQSKSLCRIARYELYAVNDLQSNSARRRTNQPIILAGLLDRERAHSFGV